MTSPPQGLAYLDTSAYVKLFVEEAESAALIEALRGFEGVVSSALLAVEAVRALRRLDHEAAEAAQAGLADVALLPVDELVLRHAARLGPPELRSLDAIHLATALLVREDLDVVVSYDDRLTAAAGAAGLDVLSPAG